MSELDEERKERDDISSSTLQRSKGFIILPVCENEGHKLLRSFRGTIRK